MFHAIESYISTFASAMSDMYALTAIENVGKHLVRAVKDGSYMEAREGMAFANTLSGVVMTVSVTTAEHSLEHAMSAYHQDLPHGAGLIMISKAFYEFFIEKYACDNRFICMARALGMKNASMPEDCGVADLKMSNYGFAPSEFDTLARNARETMGGLFAANPCEMTHDDCIEIFRKFYRRLTATKEDLQNGTQRIFETSEPRRDDCRRIGGAQIYASSQSRGASDYGGAERLVSYAGGNPHFNVQADWQVGG